MAALLLCSGCIGPQYSDQEIVVNGRQPPRILGPRDPAIAANLTTNFWASQPFLGSAAEVGTTLFKSAGIQGWKDYHMDAVATGVALRHEFTSGPYLTLDMRLQSLTVNHVAVRFHGTNYMRVVTFLGKVSVGPLVYEETNPVVAAHGKLVWNRDGWFEIHPQETGDVGLVVPALNGQNLSTVW
ncbi:MAG TPA: hypothetical protein VMH87_00190 [Pseudomonadales bacterium]|nr:hypothetical protein [Pseudomonadales bacterium]